MNNSYLLANTFALWRIENTHKSMVFNEVKILLFARGMMQSPISNNLFKRATCCVGCSANPPFTNCTIDNNVATVKSVLLNAWGKKCKENLGTN